MKTKIFTLTIMSALALVMVMSCVSADVENGVTLSIDTDSLTNVSVGDAFDITATLVNTNASDFYVVFGTTNWVWSGDESYLNASATEDYNGELTIPSSQPATKSVIAKFYDASNHSDLIFQLSESIDITYAESEENETETTSDEPEDITECSTTGNDGELYISEIDIAVTEGLGDDDEYWYPFDEVEIEFDVENHGDWDLEDIELKACLFDNDAGECMMDEDDMEFNDDKFNLDEDDDDMEILVTFDVDPDKLNDGNTDYTFYVWAEGNIDDSAAGTLDGADICTYESADIEIRIDEEFIMLNNFNFPEIVTCGEEVVISFDAWNIDSDKIDEEDIFIEVYSTKLGIAGDEIIVDTDIRSLDNEEFFYTFEVPEGLEDGWYDMKISVYDDEDMDSSDIYETSENDEAEYKISIKIEGCSVTAVTNPVLVSASLDSEAAAGEELSITVTVVNNGDSTGNFIVHASGYDTWATGGLTQELLAINKGESKSATITLTPNEDAEGEQSFTLEVLSATGEVVSTKTVAVSLAEKTGFNWRDIGGNNTTLWAIGILNVILIIIIIIVAIRVAMK